MAHISIIIPAYNCETTIERCLDSILGQDFKDFEILLVDDGSTDNTPTICDSFAKNDARVKVFHKKNGGVSSARNIGLKNAEGDFITFVDSDDELTPQALSLYESSISSGINFSNTLIIGNIILNRFDGSKFTLFSSGIYSIDDMYQAGFYGCIWNKVYNACLLKDNDIIFDETLHFGEDWLFVANYLSCISLVHFIESPCYIQHLPESYGQKYNKYLSFSNMIEVYAKIKQVNIRYSHYLVDGLTMKLLQEMKHKANSESSLMIEKFKNFVGTDIKYALGKKKAPIRLLSHISNISIWRFVLISYAKLLK